MEFKIKAKKQTFQKIITVDAYNKKSYTFQNGILSQNLKLTYDKHNYIVSTLNTKDFITQTIELSKNIPPEDLRDALELKAYDELGLDQATTYLIDFFELEEKQNDKSRFYSVFVADPEAINEVFEPIRNEVKFIDFIYPKPYLIKNLYQKEILSNFGTHAFLYFERNDAFFVIYQDGEYLYTKSINYSFEHIYERFCELYGERVDEDSFFNLLYQEGLRTSNFNFQDQLMKLFNEIFLYINDVLIYAKRAHDIEEIDTIYVGSDAGEILGLNEYANTYLGIEAKKFEFDYEIESDVEIGNPFHYLSILEAIENIEGKVSPNFSLFFRPPPFLQRKSGQFLTITAASVLLALAWPIYNVSYNAVLEFQKQQLIKEERALNLKVTRLKREIQQLNDQKDEVNKKIKNEYALFDKKGNILQSIFDKKVHYPMKAKMIVKLCDDMHQYNVHLTQLTNDDSLFVFSLYAASEKKITQYIKFLTENYGQKIRTDIAKIYKDEEEKIYHGELKVTLL